MKDDIISRAAALDFIDSMNWCDEISDEAFKKITIHLENLPSAQPEREKGRWIDIDAETYTWKIRCDQCGHERSMLSTGQTYPRFCENCGADMRGKAD